jgi:hypothetical protein
MIWSCAVKRYAAIVAVGMQVLDELDAELESIETWTQARIEEGKKQKSGTAGTCQRDEGRCRGPQRLRANLTGRESGQRDPWRGPAAVYQ